MTILGNSDLDVFPLCLGGNVFGWTADEADSFAVLDAYTAAGGNFIDTADVYSSWVPGHSGGESETIIGNWLSERSNRDAMVIATKVGHNRDLRRDAILEGARRSLERLQTDRIDLYYMHNDDPETPFEESLGAFGELVRDGKVRYIGASNFSGERLSEALAVADREGLPPVVALQNEYNLMTRGYEEDPEPIVAERGLAAVPYYGLASGFLTGKYRPNGATVDSPRAQSALARL
ncbi:MAG: aldo/keto reductase, partial [Solirubrobacteraceae bacterium]